MSPISAYFGGHGKSVMKDMKERYGEKGKSIFYATANAKNQKPAGENENNGSSDDQASAVEREQIDGERPSVTRRLMRNLRDRDHRG